MNRRIFGRAAVGIAAALSLDRSATAAATSPAGHRLAMQIDTDDAATQMLALGNARNYAAHYKDKGEAFAIRIIAFGPGYSLLRADRSARKDQLAALQNDLGGALSILACENTRRALAKTEGKKPEDIALLPGVEPTPSGIVSLAELQEAGWSYIRP